ncbi:hypothetical protein Fmac_006962 [Flemingia macrophylla]|uniref:PWWP domain-containing protein n=1 Tax=Flemingia macrophylla TaxID=520843 RepID=A0ABD1NDA3_9FABA
MTELHSQHNAATAPKADDRVASDSPRVSPNNNPDDASTQEFRVRVCSDGNAPENDSDKFTGSDSKSLLSEFDEYVAAERQVTRDLGFGFEVGDMVWGKVKSHPWWPGHIYNEAFASPSVRRSKRDGHFLVAFFGDSSYGWFEPAELIPFDANFAEKSQQTNSRTFLRAVEEAVDEACRRRGLGLACRCRNADNFSPANVEGYFCVDVEDYEPGGLYSDLQIRKARDSFKPDEALAFVKQLAVAPYDTSGSGSIEFSNNKATLSAYRKAVFEQFDEPYAQAFGVQPSRPTHPHSNPLDQPGNVRHPPRAPLSGPLVIADTSGGGKNTTKSVKVKEALKKDRYLLKRRDYPNNSVQLAYKEDKIDPAAHYVIQNRAPAAPLTPHDFEKQADTGFTSHDGAASILDAKEALIGQVQADDCSLPTHAISDAKPHLDKGKESAEVTHGFERDDATRKSMVRSDLPGELALLSNVDEISQPSHLENQVSVDAKHDGNAKVSGPCEDFKKVEQEPMTIADGLNDMHQVKNENNICGLPVEAKLHKINAMKKIKSHKRPADALNSKTSAVGQGKKKKKRDLNSQPTLGSLEKHSMFGKSVHLSGKSTGKVVSPREDFSVEQVEADVNTRNLLAMDTIGNANFELPQLLGDLQALALNPYHGIEKKIPAAVQQFFLRFRSLVYQKSLVVSPPTADTEAPEVRDTKSPSRVRVSDNPDEYVRSSPVVKSVKHIGRPVDPTKAGWKRAPSDRQEEMAAKRLKKIKDLKAHGLEKVATNPKIAEARREDGKESIPQAPSKLVKLDTTKKLDHPTKTVEPTKPTTLMIKFPPKASLPSIAELKAKFVRFGPMDQTGFRVSWDSSSCRVVFLHKADAQAAHDHCLANQSFFGGMSVKCSLREFGDSAPGVSEVAKAKGDDGANETPRIKDPAVVHRQTSASLHHPLPQPIQLKSCLKKSTGEELGQVMGNGSSSKGNPRVKFLLGGEESSRGDQSMVGSRTRNNFNNDSFADAGAPPVATDFNSKNVQKVTLQPSMTIPPPVTQFTKIPQHNFRNSELAMAPRNSPIFINTNASATAPTVDISQQMIHLLTRCSDVVTNLTGLLGYVPYHPL